MNLFDKKIKQKLSQAEMPVEDGIWEAIESRIVHQKDNSRFWFLLIIPLLFAPAALMMWNSTHKLDNNALVAEASSKIVSDQNPTNTIAGKVKLIPAASSKAPQSLSLLSALPGINRSNNFLNSIASNKDQINDFGFKLSGFTTNNKTTPESARYNTSKVSVINGEIISGQLKQNNITPLPSNQFAVASLDSESRGLSSLFANNDPGAECHDFKVYHPGFYAYTQFTADMPFQSLTARSSEFVNYVNRRNETESAAFSNSFTMGVGYRFDNGLFAESGLTIDRINMNFNLPGDDEVRFTTVITIDTMITVDKDTLISIDTTNIQIDGTDPVFATNHFTQIDIPMVIGFEFPLGEKVRLGLKGGVLVNIRSTNSGQMVGLDDEPLEYGSNSRNDNQYFKTNIGFSYTGGLNLEADVSKSFSIYGGMNLRYYPNSFSRNDNPVQQNYTKLGLLAGLKYRI